MHTISTIFTSFSKKYMARAVDHTQWRCTITKMSRCKYKSRVIEKRPWMNHEDIERHSDINHPVERSIIGSLINNTIY